jgi:hypothetical protein
MDTFGMLRAVASVKRLEPYLAVHAGDRSAAVRLYAWNIQVSAAFQAPIGCLEIAYRNALDQQLAALFRRDDWWLAPQILLHRTAQRMVDEATQEIQRRGESPTPGRTVAELSFGFWVSLLGSGTDYETRLWRPALRHAFPGYRGRRAPLHRQLDDVRRLRNRIAHHEPIHRRDLAADHEGIYRLLAYIPPEYADWVRLHDRVPDVLVCREGVCMGSLVASF